MQPDDNARVGHVFKEARHVALWIDGQTYETFVANEILNAAVTRALQIVGEACWQLTDEFRERLPEVSWKEIIAMRHKLVHAYFAVDLRIIWSVATVHLPVLTRQLLPFAPAEEE